MRLLPVPWMVTCGLLEGTFTVSRYVPGFTAMTTREALSAGTASTAAWTDLYCAVPSLATVSVVAAFVAAPPCPLSATPIDVRGPAPASSSLGTSAASSSV